MIVISPDVVESVISGSDLFIPGITRMSPVRPQSGSLVSIASASSPTVPLAIGIMCLDAENIRIGGKHKAVSVLHTYNDFLWDLGSKLALPTEINALESDPEEASKAVESSDTADETAPTPQLTSSTATSAQETLNTEGKLATMH